MKSSPNFRHEAKRPGVIANKNMIADDQRRIIGLPSLDADLPGNAILTMLLPSDHRTYVRRDSKVDLTKASITCRGSEDNDVMNNIGTEGRDRHVVIRATVQLALQGAAGTAESIAELLVLSSRSVTRIFGQAHARGFFIPLRRYHPPFDLVRGFRFIAVRAMLDGMTIEEAARWAYCSFGQVTRFWRDYQAVETGLCEGLGDCAIAARAGVPLSLAGRC